MNMEKSIRKLIDFKESLEYGLAGKRNRHSVVWVFDLLWKAETLAYVEWIREMVKSVTNSRQYYVVCWGDQYAIIDERGNFVLKVQDIVYINRKNKWSHFVVKIISQYFPRVRVTLIRPKAMQLANKWRNSLISKYDISLNKEGLSARHLEINWKLVGFLMLKIGLKNVIAPIFWWANVQADCSIAFG